MARRLESAGLTPERRAAMTAELQMLQTRVREAEEDLKIHTLRCYEQGLTESEEAAALAVSRRTIITWKGEGEQARERRRGEHLGRPSDRKPVG